MVELYDLGLCSIDLVFVVYPFELDLGFGLCNLGLCNIGLALALVVAEVNLYYPVGVNLYYPVEVNLYYQEKAGRQ
jgi:hypothetical protein